MINHIFTQGYAMALSWRGERSSTGTFIPVLANFEMTLRSWSNCMCVCVGEGGNYVLYYDVSYYDMV